jgi:hypothetical protein
LWHSGIVPPVARAAIRTTLYIPLHLPRRKGKRERTRTLAIFFVRAVKMAFLG